MIEFGILDLAFGMLIFVSLLAFGSTVHFSWISRRALLIFLIIKFCISVGTNVWAILSEQEYDAAAYYTFGMRHAEMLNELLRGVSTDYLNNTPFFWIEGISTDRLNSLSGLLLTLTGGSFLGATLLMCQVGAAGQLLIFRYLRQRFPEANHIYFYLVLFHPSLMLWTSSLLKDTLGILALGLVIYHVNEYLTRASVWRLAWIGFGCYLAFLFRTYIFVIIVGFGLFAYWDRKLEHGPAGGGGPLFKLFYVCTSIFGIIGVLVYTLQNFGKELVEAQRQSDLLYSSIEAGTTFRNVELSFSLGGLLALPIGVVNAVLRPFPWEVTKLNQLAAAFENVVMVVLVLRGWFIFHFRLPPAAKRYARTIMYGGLVLTLVCAAGVGLYSSNLGTISRYRIPIIPMLLAGPCVALALHSSASRWGHARSAATPSLRRRSAPPPWARHAR